MSAIVMKGTELAEKIKKHVKSRIKRLKRSPELVVISTVNDPSSESYLKGIIKDCQECNIICTTVRFPETYAKCEDDEHDELMIYIHELNKNKSVNGILFQTPVKKDMPSWVINSIDSNKDVDCQTVTAFGKAIQQYGFIKPCTCSAIIDLLESYKVDIKNKNIVIVNRSSRIGKPLAMLLPLYGAGPVTLCGRNTDDLSSLTKTADILITAVGQKNFITADMIKEGAVIIDAGVSYEDGKVYGDCDFDALLEKASYISPVIGGVGPLTRAILMQNTCDLASIQRIEFDK